MRWQDGTLLLATALLGFLAVKPYIAPVADNEKQVEMEQHIALMSQQLEEIQSAMQQPQPEAKVVQESAEAPMVAATEGDDALNEVKARFEGLFVNYQYLRGCEAASGDDYHLLNSALMHELASKSAPARMQYDILTAAQGTYEEIYARSDCDAQSMAAMKDGFDRYMQQVRQMRFVIAK